MSSPGCLSVLKLTRHKAAEPVGVIGNAAIFKLEVRGSSPRGFASFFVPALLPVLPRQMSGGAMRRWEIPRDTSPAVNRFNTLHRINGVEWPSFEVLRAAEELEFVLASATAMHKDNAIAGRYNENAEEIRTLYWGELRHSLLI